jgi:hypothetical protein
MELSLIVNKRAIVLISTQHVAQPPFSTNLQKLKDEVAWPSAISASAKLACKFQAGTHLIFSVL